MSQYSSTRSEDGDTLPVTMKKILQQLRAVTKVSITNPTDEVGILGEIETISHEHKHVHDGSSFLAADRQSMSNNTSRRYKITVPAGTQVAHLFWRFSTTAQFYLELFESPTSVTGGTPLTALNRNRNKLQGPLLEITQGVTAGGDGTRLDVIQLGSGATGTKVSNDAQALSEWVLKPGTDYLIHIRCESAGSFSLQLQWYQTAVDEYDD